MKKTSILLIILFNVAGSLFLATLMNPSLFSSIFYAGSKLGDFSLAIKGEGITGGDWFVSMQLWVLFVTFLISTIFAIVTFISSQRGKAFLKKLPFTILLVLLLVGVFLYFWGRGTCSGEECIGIYFLLQILALVFYGLLQIIFVLLISYWIQIGRGAFANTILVVGSILFLSLFLYATTTCGYPIFSRDNCNYKLADSFIKIELCDKIVNSSRKKSCIFQVQNRQEILRRRINPQVVFDEGIPKCQALSFDQWPYKGDCYETLIIEASIQIFTVFHYPCTAVGIHTSQEEQDLIQCLQEFSTRKSSAEEYRKSCQNLSGEQKDNCIRIAR